MVHGPTHQFCSGCSAMLPPHLSECPRCGQDLLKADPDALKGKDIFKITGVVVLIAAIPLLLMIVIAVLCLAATN